MKTATKTALTALITGLALGSPAQAQSSDFTASAEAINAAMRSYHYDPAELDLPAYQAIEAATLELGASASSAEDFMTGYNALWVNGPFSHVRLSPAQGPVAAMAAHFDAMEIGGGGAVLTWQNDTAILDVNTMMGMDTIAEIEAAYGEIASRSADKLIIDLRGNSGGAFAVKPLVEHVITESFDAGAFISQPWNAAYDRAPDADDIAGIDPWTGWSIISFWETVQSEMITRIRFEPETEDHFSGPVYVLIDDQTFSAAEMAADALDASGRVTIIGEATQGRMLSQTIFDIPGGFHLALPIADYYSIRNGRIEGVGVAPDVSIDADSALDYALAQ